MQSHPKVIPGNFLGHPMSDVCCQSCATASGQDALVGNCLETTCHAHGNCTLATGHCTCDPGWNPATACEERAPPPPPTDPCDGVTCDGHGSCLAVFGSATTAECNCEQGFSNPDGNTLDCVAPPPPPPADPCDGVTCSGHGNCLATDGVATCACTSDGAYIYHHPEGNPLDCVSSSTPVGPEPGPGTLPAR